jgi:hypothetical protein
MRSTGEITWLANMLNATKAPTVISPPITSWAPTQRIATVTSLATVWIRWLPMFASEATRKDEAM